jgi:hypothetical protein
MPVDERRRLALHDAAKHALGPEAAVTLMEMLPPNGWGELATKADLAAGLDQLEARIDARFEVFEHRFAVFEQWFEGFEHRFEGFEHRFEGFEHRFDSLEHRLTAQMDRRFRAAYVFMTTTILAGFAATIAAVRIR